MSSECGGGGPSLKIDGTEMGGDGPVLGRKTRPRMWRLTLGRGGCGGPLPDPGLPTIESDIPPRS